MNLFLIIYGIIAFVVFIGLEVFSIVECERENAIFIRPVYKINHFKLLLAAVFFPVLIIMVIALIIAEKIIEGSKKK